MAAALPDSEEFPVFTASRILSIANRWDHFLARWGWKRSEHKVRPGLYTVGTPTPDAPVLVTANYTLSFDALRSNLNKFDAYILVLNTFGVNVWCAAGKGTFGTEELIERIETSGITGFVRQHKVILPQLGAAGVAAHEVRRRTGFKVEYGPVRAEDLPHYLSVRKLKPEMRQARFNILDRMVLIPVEITNVFLPTLLVAAAVYFAGGLFMSLAVIGGVLTGSVLFPILLPWLPTKDFSTKGFILGAVFGGIVIYLSGIWIKEIELWQKIGLTLSHFLIWPSLVGYLALNFTGSTPFASRSGVRKEISRYIRIMAVAFVAGVLLNLVLGFLK